MVDNSDKRAGDPTGTFALFVVWLLVILGLIALYVAVGIANE